MRFTTAKGQRWDIDLAGRRVRSFDQKGETDGWDGYLECSIPSVGRPTIVTLEAGLEMAIDPIQTIEDVTVSDEKFLKDMAESLKNTNGGC